jgi:hypothetical protein
MLPGEHHDEVVGVDVSNSLLGMSALPPAKCGSR